MVQAASLDPAEVAKFSAMAAAWWDQDGAFAPLHRMNPVRLGFIRDVALAVKAEAGLPAGGRRALAGLSILDLGCGGGLAAIPLARLGAKVTGVDASEETIGVARAQAGRVGVEVDFRVGTAESFAGEDAGGPAPAVRTPGQFDIVTALEIVEHVASVPSFLNAAAALVRPGGRLIVSTINRTQRARLFAIVGAERFLKWAPEGTHEFEKLVAPEELECAPGLSWEAPVGLRFDPVGREWTLSRDVGINYFRVARKL